MVLSISTHPRASSMIARHALRGIRLSCYCHGDSYRIAPRISPSVLPRSRPVATVRKRRMSVTAAKVTPITFYDILPAPGSCPFAHRAWLTLEELGLPYEHKLVDPENKPEDFKALYASIVQNTDDSAKVPIIIDGNSKVTESLVVVEYLDAKYGGDSSSILPKDPLQLADVKLFVELFSSKYQSLFFKLLRAGSDDEVNELAKQLEHNLEVLDKFIRASGSSEGGDYFLGGRYSFAETVTTPFLRRSLVTLPYFKKVDPREIVKERGFTRIDSWIKAVLDRESNKKTGPSDEAIIENFKRFVTTPVSPDYKFKVSK